MAVSFDVGSQATPASSTSSLTWSHTCSGSDRGLFVGAGVEWFGPTVSTITYNSVSMTLMWNAVFSTFFGHAGARLAGPATGANNVVITMSGTVDQMLGGAISMNGVHQTTPVGTHVSGTGSTANPSLTVADVGSGDMVVDNITMSSLAGALTPDTGQTQRYNCNTGGGGQHARGSTQSGADGGVMSWTIDSGTPNSGRGAVAFKPAEEEVVSLFRGRYIGVMP